MNTSTGLVKWRVKEPRQFIRNNGTDIRNAENRLIPIVQAALNEEVTKRTVGAVLNVRPAVLAAGLTRATAVIPEAVLTRHLAWVAARSAFRLPQNEEV